MQTLRDIRRRIRSVQSTRQIARAMEMVSAARLKRAQARVLTARPYAEKMETVVRKVCAASAETVHPFLASRDVKSLGVCVLTSDRGLCGAFNSNVIRRAEEFAEERRGASGRPAVQFLPVGRKAFLHFRKVEKRLKCFVPELGAFAEAAKARGLTSGLVNLYLCGELDETWLVYTHFVSSGSRRISVERLLPVDVGEKEGVAQGYGYIFEPPARRLMDELLPRYVGMKVFMCMADSCASEHSARMIAMSFATKNADDMTYDLTLLRNRARQASITKEIADIVGTAEVLR
ncbi:MAG: ATP synthase F1 subunit gamma [Candidatus Eisenbacteria bacterium]